MKARLIVADSERDANMLYATGMFVPDPFIWFAVRGTSCVVMSDLEIDRARKQATVDRVLSYTHYHRRLRRQGVREPRFSDVLNCVLRDFRIRQVEVPASFPIGLVKKLRGVRVAVKPDPFFPNREIKTPSEIARLAAAMRLSEDGMRAAIDLLRKSRIGRAGFLYRQKRKLTAEDVRGAVDSTIAGLGGIAAHTIVACGNQGCDPHETGHGPLRAHASIIVDIFPRDMKSGYFGDITRTVVRGRASEAVKRLYALVGNAQALAFRKLRTGINGKDVHDAIQKLFADAGYKTGRVRGRMQGFFHGTGHGLGLEVHERPRVSTVSEILRAGHVVTVEPGLYYWGVGGVRLEDVAVIGDRTARNLTVFPKQLEI
ncbi:MAG TPA: Xaa-Pro peptidase family protein [Verrucomicrobiae bacterium]|nr:Xaa-Pro peptidase family protein [Verrucomicrobiae bacterium]